MTVTHQKSDWVKMEAVWASHWLCKVWDAILGTKMDWKSHINSNGVKFLWHSGGQRENCYVWNNNNLHT